jgi:hypothetical protein
MRPSGPPAFGEAEREAWRIVLHAIERAIDIDDLAPYDRGVLAELHAHAGRQIGLRPPAMPITRMPGKPLDGVRATGNVFELGRFGVTADVLGLLAYRAGIRRVADLERRTDDVLLGIDRIGPKRLAAIRLAVRRYKETAA